MPIETTADTSAAPPVFDLPFTRRLVMALGGYIPLLHTALVVVLLSIPFIGLGPWWLALLSVALLYLLPPLVVRAVGIVWPLKEGQFSLHSAMFLRWWFVAQWQVLFNRLPMLEEILRLVPGLYSTWLRLWGASIGRWIYWSPGVIILDRSLIEVGDRVVFGAAARVHAHVITRSKDKPGHLVLAAVRVEADAMIGGLSLMSPGVHVHRGEMAPGCKPLPPFSLWRGGRRVREHQRESRT